MILVRLVHFHSIRDYYQITLRHEHAALTITYGTREGTLEQYQQWRDNSTPLQLSIPDPLPYQDNWDVEDTKVLLEPATTGQ